MRRLPRKPFKPSSQLEGPADKTIMVQLLGSVQFLPRFFARVFAWPPISQNEGPTVSIGLFHDTEVDSVFRIAVPALSGRATPELSLSRADRERRVIGQVDERDRPPSLRGGVGV